MQTNIATIVQEEGEVVGSFSVISNVFGVASVPDFADISIIAGGNATQDTAGGNVTVGCIV